MLDRALKRLHPRFLSVTSKTDIGTKPTSSGTPKLSTLTYWVDGKLGGTLSGDLATKYFGGSDHVHFGFTGATGTVGNIEQVRVTQLSANAGELEYGALVGV